jgi:UDP-N-acetylglucosamine 2-epimerase (non-hydrolysing)
VTKPAEVHLIVAARPNFMKVAPLYHALKDQDWCHPVLVHTGQHYDANLSQQFISDFGLPEPHFHLGIGSGTHAEQTGRVMIAYEYLCQDHRPEWTIVVGDVNSTMACALVAAKLGISLSHLEAGLRSRDRTMPEEINRIVTDAVADVLWTPSVDGDENLLAEGVPATRIALVGNIMIDAYELLRDRIDAAKSARDSNLNAQGYGIVTLHRPSNVDRPEMLKSIVDQLIGAARQIPIVFSVHPRTRARLQEFGFLPALAAADGIRLVDPMGYIEFMGLVCDAKFVLTDSGGLQEETTYLHIPCLTLRENTERPITVTQGTNRLIGVDSLMEAIGQVMAGSWPKGTRPALWDGHTASRVAEDLRKRLKAPAS